MTTKLFERLVTKFSIKVNDLAKYLEISKATIYNYRNLEKFDDIPKDKQIKILYLFGKESETELELLLDESDQEILAQYVNRISSILKDSINGKKDSIASIEELTEKVRELSVENAELQRQTVSLKKFSNLDEFTKAVLFDKIAAITANSSPSEMKEFIDYLDIFEKYRNSTR